MDTSTSFGLLIGLVTLYGALSFFSPCIVSLLPVYIGYLSGTAAQSSRKSQKVNLFVNTLFFVFGIGITFLLLGFAATSFVGLLDAYRHTLSVVGGILIAFFGFFQLGIIQSNKLMQDVHLPISMEKIGNGPFGAFIFGLFFSFAWTPCVGPILASVITLVGNTATQIQGMVLTFFYTLGMAIPFLLIALATDSILPWLRSHTEWSVRLSKFSGILLIAIGIAMIFGLIGGTNGF